MASKLEINGNSGNERIINGYSIYKKNNGFRIACFYFKQIGQGILYGLSFYFAFGPRYWPYVESILKNAALAFGPRRWPFVGGGMSHCLFSTLNILEEGFPMDSSWMNNW